MTKERISFAASGARLEQNTLHIILLHSLQRRHGKYIDIVGKTRVLVGSGKSEFNSVSTLRNYITLGLFFPICKMETTIPFS